MNRLVQIIGCSLIALSGCDRRESKDKEIRHGKTFSSQGELWEEYEYYATPKGGRILHGWRTVISNFTLRGDYREEMRARYVDGVLVEGPSVTGIHMDKRPSKELKPSQSHSGPEKLDPGVLERLR